MQFFSLIAGLLLFYLLAPFAALIAAIGTNDSAAIEVFSLTILTVGTVSVLSLLATHRKRFIITRAQLFVAAIVLWLVLIIAGMPPFIVLESHSFLVAFFESSSAATTMGHSLMPVGDTSWAMIVFRGTLAWLGGFLTLVLAVYVLGRYNVGGTPSKDLRIVLRAGEYGRYNIRRTITGIALPYVALTIFGALLLMAVRIQPALALVTSMNAISTNGLVAVQSAGTIFGNIAAEFALMFLMICGASSILVVAAFMYRKQKQLQEHRDTYMVTLFCLLTFLMTGLAAVGLQGAAWREAFSVSHLFDIVSTITTTSLVHDGRVGLQIPIELAIVLALVGGAAFSTSGGFKQFRMLLMLDHAANDIRRLVYPHRILAKSHDVDTARANQLKAVWSTFFVSLIVLVLLMIALALQGFDLAPGLAVAVGALTNSAALVGEHLFETIDGRVSGYALILISLAGLAGRLEILVILAALSRWR